MGPRECHSVSILKGEHQGGDAFKEFPAISPLELPDWDLLLPPNGSFFHTRPWARVLHDTYGHEPFYFSHIVNARIQALLPTMQVSSCLTGRRGVSLPFTDFCPALFGSASEGQALVKTVLDHGRLSRWRYVEFRTNESMDCEAEPSVRFYGHFLDLGRKTEDLYKGLTAAMRRGIRKALAASLRVEMHANLESIRTFYSLHCRTRRRHGIPPQPLVFFENIARHVLSAGRGFVALALLQNKPVGAAVFFQNGAQALYKFGASDFRCQHLRPNNLLMWEAIKHCVELGCSSLHLGRTSQGQEGLRRFKLGFGAQEQNINYYKYDFAKQAFVSGADLATNRLTAIFRHFPPPLFRLAGRLLYPHLS
jgi:hypothetical protein